MFHNFFPSSHYYYYYYYQVKKDNRQGIQHAQGNYIQFWLESLKGRGNSKDIGSMDGMTILKFTLRK